MDNVHAAPTSIDVTGAAIPRLCVNRMAVTLLREGNTLSGNRTGARVTVTFDLPAPVPRDCAVRIRYEIAECGEARDMVGVPQLTHTTVRSGDSSYHYRMSHWLAGSILQ